ncbi:unnamed protein product [Mytilus edulis]|uniref:Uncharacterized protein n=1 Tax=Mytilus edulis TaxID=6550 RepID=A0A8S3PXQ6_MYTED|nr:unnamed protein product [Mytilus edulis]
MGRLDVVRCLLENKANINKANDHGTTPLSYACEVGHTDIEKLLLDKHAILDSFDNDGFTPLIISCLNNNTSAVQLLMKHKPDINAQTYDGGSALFFSALNGNLEITQLFPLYVASQAEQTDIIKSLLERHPDVNMIMTEGETTALWCSCFTDNSRIVELFIAHTTDINAQIIDGSCSLFISALNGNVDIVQLLLENNADCNICCHNKQSAIDKLTNIRIFDDLAQSIYFSYLTTACSLNVNTYVRERLSKSREYA